MNRKSIVFLTLAILLATGLISFFLLGGDRAAAWYDPGWNYRKTLTINHSQVSGSTNLTNFPVLVSLSSDTNLSANAQSDGDDIFFTDASGNKLDHQIDTYSAGTLIAWVEVPTLDYDDNTILYMYYGNATASSQQNATGVWDSNYQGVWHMGESSGTRTDATAYDNDLTEGGTVDQVDGKIGKAAQFEKASTSDRLERSDANLSTNFPGKSTYTTTAMTASTWVKYNSIPNSSESANMMVKSASGPNLYFLYNSNGIHQSLFDTTNPQGATTVNSTSAWYYVTMVWSGSSVQMYLNGAADGSPTALASFLTNTTAFYVGTRGSSQASTRKLDGVMDETRISNVARSADWIATEYNNQNAPSTFMTVSAQQAQEGGPSAYWRFDEGSGTSVNDSSGNSVTGTLGTGSSAPTWTPEDRCMSGMCLQFDGSNDYLSIGSTVSEIKTVSFWTRPSTATDEFVVFDGTNTYISASSGTVSATGFTSPTVYVNGVSGATTITANKWNHIAVTTSTGVTGSNIQIGKVNSGYTQGFIDEVKVYPYVRTAAEIKADFVGASSSRGSSVVLGAGDLGSLSEGLVGYWNMEGIGSTGNGVSIPDKSGNGNNGTTDDGANNTGMNCTSVGKYGGGCDFDGSDDYVSIPHTSTVDLDSFNAFSMSTWVKVDGAHSGNANIITKWGANLSNRAFRLSYNYSSSNEFFVATDNSGGLSFDGLVRSTTIPVINQWYHIAIVWTSADTLKLYVNGTLEGSDPVANTNLRGNSNSILIGARQSASIDEYFNGQVDEVRIYNRALSAAEVLALYKWAPGPVAYYSFDEGTGTSLADKSTNAFNGTLGTGSSAPSWTAGKFGNALQFDGTLDSVVVGDGQGNGFNILDGQGAMTLGAWILPGFTQTSGSQTHFIFDNGPIQSYFVPTQDDMRFTVQTSTGTTNLTTTGLTWNANEWHYITGVYDGTNMYFYWDGIPLISTAKTGAISTTSNILDYIGAGHSVVGDDSWLGSIDEVKFYNYARTPEQIAEDMNAGHPAVGTPIGSSVLHLSFDEGYGSTANDKSPQDNDASLAVGTSAPSWSNEGKWGKALSFDGSNDYASVADTAELDFDGTAASFSVSTWFKSGTATNPAATEYLINKSNATTAGYGMYVDTSGYICFGIDDDTTWGPDIASCTATDYYDNNWHHIMGVKDKDADKTYIYVDGVQKDSDTDTTTASFANSLSLYLGDRDGSDNGNELNGLLDEVKIYPFALSADQVKTEYNGGKQLVLGSTSTTAGGTAPSNAASREYCPPGDTSTCTAPIFEMLMNENVRGDSQTLYDTSTNGYNGTTNDGANNTGMNCAVPGKVGTGCLIDGTDDYITMGDVDGLDMGSSQDFTISLWVNSQSYSNVQTVVTKKTTNLTTVAGYLLNIGTGAKFNLYVADSDGDGLRTSNNTALATNTWYHVTATYDADNAANSVFYINGNLDVGSTTVTVDSGSGDSAIGSLANSIPLYIGARSNNNDFQTNGIIDQVRIYNYVRSPAQVAWEYNKGGPLAHYKFDECTGTTAYNSVVTGSGLAAGNNGTITIGASGANTSAGTCTSGSSVQAWANGSSGKWGSSLDFDGTDDYVDLGTGIQLGQNLTISAWVYPETYNVGAFGYPAIVVRSSAFDESIAKYAFYLYGKTGEISFSYNGNILNGVSGSTTTVPLNAWSHVAVTQDSSNIRLYLNGKQVYTRSAFTGTPSYSTETTKIGAWLSSSSDGEFAGRIDDVRIYPFALTADQMRQLYNNGSAIRFD